MNALNHFIVLTPQLVLLLGFTFLIKKKKFSFELIDTPDNYRKLHENPTSSSGGFLILIGIFYLLILDCLNFHFLNDNIKFYLEGFKSKISFYFISFCFFLLGYFDDKHDIKSSIKLILLILFIYLAQLLNPELTIKTFYFSFLKQNIILNKDLAIFFTTFSILVFINALNMFDGKNLQIGIYCSTFLFFIIFKNQNTILFVLLLSIIIFLSLNYNGKMFMGNNGTHLLGYILSFLIIKTYNSDYVFIFADEIFILMMLPGIDLIRLFFKRIKKKQNPFTGDLDHIHHILSLKFKNYQIQIILFLLIMISILLFNFTNFYISCFFMLISYITLIIYSKK